MAMLLLVAFVALWALLPVKSLEATLQSEVSQMEFWGGTGSDQWIKSRMAAMTIASARSIMRASDALGTKPIGRWMTGRLYASLVWMNLAAYRATSLLLWSFVGIPLMLAAAIDGFYVREIRKTSFTQQSPLRHRVGVYFSRWASVGIVAWLLVPFPVPSIVIPLTICVIAFAMWMWAAHLQKRL